MIFCAARRFRCLLLSTTRTRLTDRCFVQRPHPLRLSYLQLATIRSPAGRSSFTTDLHATSKLSHTFTRHIAAIRTLNYRFPSVPCPNFFWYNSRSIHPNPLRRMSKSAAASAPKLSSPLPQRSAWSKGPPNTSSAPTPRTQSPAPASSTSSATPSHSRRPSTLGQGVAFKDGVAGARSPVGAPKSGTLAFPG